MFNCRDAEEMQQNLDYFVLWKFIYVMIEIYDIMPVIHPKTRRIGSAGAIELSIRP